MCNTEKVVDVEGAPGEWTGVVFENVVGKNNFDMTIEGHRLGRQEGTFEEDGDWRIIGESPNRVLEYNFTYENPSHKKLSNV